ncbi:MAG: TonB-dependent receptor [Flavobacteriales bacterium]|nr:TonB-dependent receptor [Flavobacteriales bacterium]
MFNKKLSIAVLIALPIIGFAQQQDSIPIQQLLEEVNVKSTEAGKKTPMAFTNISEKEIENINLGQDLPCLISLTPSVVYSSDAGAGIGYTYMTIRGTDASRINVTINGIPLNDSESQGVWWVNMPDFTSSVSNIQIQRGVGTSTNGGSAFGATVNLQTDGLRKDKYLTTSNSVGSFNSIKNNIEFGTGLLNGKFTLDGRLSQITSDGFIDRASSNLKSFYFAGGYYGETSILKAIVFSGQERTYQAWYGVPQQYLDTLPTFNPYNYKDEVDDYSQTHFQLHYNKQLSPKTYLNLATHYTKGGGFYEQYVGTEHNSILYDGDYIFGQNSLSYYGLEDVIVDGDTITTTNLIRRKWLDNNFYGITFSLNHSTNNLNLILGGAANTYVGQHFGKVISTEIHGDLEHEYYRNEATKNDYNIYLKGDYKLTQKINLFADLQSRIIDYNFEGLNDDGTIANQNVNLNFFNPKFGLFYNISDKTAIYTSYSVANKEPNRNDYVESSPSDRPLHETLYDTEIGLKHKSENFTFGINLYHMDYNNQLINTGEINDVGYSVHSNIKDSYRKGIELEAAVKITNKLSWSGNLTLSENKIVSHDEYIETWDYPVVYPIEGFDIQVMGEDTLFHKSYENTDISFSPNIIWVSQFNYKLKDNFNIDVISKYVGEQFIDNTSSEDRKLDDYLVNNLRLTYNLKFKNVKEARLTLMVNNVLDNQYSNRAWIYRFVSKGWDPRGEANPYTNADSDRYNMIGQFPQAGRNFLLGLTLGF